jgi:ribonuclease BN (tRNA processing enzyme)
MDIRVLGCSGGIGGPDNRTTSLLVDHDILIDCGTGAGVLSFEQLLAIDHVFITHSHLDHIALLPLLVDTVGDFRTRPITVHASDETVRILRSHIFNWLVWPDFTAIPDRDYPFLRLQPLTVGETVALGDRRITAVPVLHAVPAVGYRLTGQTGSLVFSGDTTLCDAFVDALNAMSDLRHLIIETAFPDAQHDLALAARHLCPSMLRVLLERLSGDPEIFVTHLKPGSIDEISQELQTGFGRLKPGLLRNDQVFSL